MTSELDKVLTSSNWLREMLVAVEHIPICVTVAAASMAMPGFPLLYVNRAFESTTGYTRQEIIGQNCRFLQLGKLDGEVSEQDSINRLSYALSEAKPVRVAITNYRKDGTSFSNLLAMKPIMDEVSCEFWSFPLVHRIASHRLFYFYFMHLICKIVAIRERLLHLASLCLS